jgi:plasmid stabilization system protein ParE
MIRRHIIRPAADQEIREIFSHCERQRPGLGGQFEAELEATIARIIANPEMYSLVHRDVRRAILRPFPYGVFYKVRRDVLYVVAVVHLARDPRIWQRRR